MTSDSTYYFTRRLHILFYSCTIDVTSMKGRICRLVNRSKARSATQSRQYTRVSLCPYVVLVHPWRSTFKFRVKSRVSFRKTYFVRTCVRADRHACNAGRSTKETEGKPHGRDTQMSVKFRSESHSSGAARISEQGNPLSDVSLPLLPATTRVLLIAYARIRNVGHALARKPVSQVADRPVRFGAECLWPRREMLSSRVCVCKNPLYVTLHRRFIRVLSQLFRIIESHVHAKNSVNCEHVFLSRIF